MNIEISITIPQPHHHHQSPSSSSFKPDVRLEGASKTYGARCRPVYISRAPFVVPAPYIFADFDRIEVDVKVVWLSFVGGELDV